MHRQPLEPLDEGVLDGEIGLEDFGHRLRASQSA